MALAPDNVRIYGFSAEPATVVACISAGRKEAERLRNNYNMINVFYVVDVLPTPILCRQACKPQTEIVCLWLAGLLSDW